MGIETNKLLKQLNEERSITDIFKENQKKYMYMTIGECINLEIRKRKISKAKLIRDSGINKRFFYSILSGEKIPSRRYIVRIFMAFKLELRDVQWYLKVLGYPQLYARDKYDSIIIYCINHKMSIKTCNEMLKKIGLESLGFESL